MLRLHPKYGVNPTMPVCAWCGKSTGEIILLGAAYKDEAPREMIFNLEPCEKCKAEIGDGVLIGESSDGKTITGRIVGLKREAFERCFNLRPVPPFCLMEPKAFQEAFSDYITEKGDLKE